MIEDLIEKKTSNMKYLNSYADKETTEWANFWYDKANHKSDRRILLIGDSVSRQIRSTMSALLQCPVDLFATSAALRDRMFWDQLKCFFENGLYSYEAIFIWVGNHSRRNEDGTDYFSDHDYQRFHSDFTTLIEISMEIAPKVIILSTLHMFIRRNSNKYIEFIREIIGFRPKEILDDNENAVVEVKNKIIQQVANEHGLPFYDIDKTLLESKYWHKDNIHYISKSNKFVASRLIELL